MATISESPVPASQAEKVKINIGIIENIGREKDVDQREEAK